MSAVQGIHWRHKFLIEIYLLFLFYRKLTGKLNNGPTAIDAISASCVSRRRLNTPKQAVTYKEHTRQLLQAEHRTKNVSKQTKKKTLYLGCTEQPANGETKQELEALARLTTPRA